MTFFCFSVSKYGTIYRWAYQSSHISEYCFLTAQVWQGVVLCAVAHIGMITKRHINISPHAFTCLTALVWFVYTVTHLSIICNLPCLSLYISSVDFMHHTFKRIPLAMYMYQMLSSKYHWHTLVICIIYIYVYIFILRKDMVGRYYAIDSPQGSRWGQKSRDRRSRDFCPHRGPSGELIG